MTGDLALHALTVGAAHTEGSILRWLDHVDATEMLATHTSNRALASTLGVSETVVRGLRSGARPLRDDRVSLFGPRLRAAFDTALRGPVQLSLF